MLDRSLNMLRSQKCLCIPLETGCFLFGVFSAVISGLGVLALSLARSWMTYVLDDDTYERFTNHPKTMNDVFDSEPSHQQIVDLMTTVTAVMFLYIWFLTSFIFSVFLCYGTHKKRPGFVKAYLVYGVVVNILMMIGACLYSWLMMDILGGSLVLIASGLYSTILLTIQRTHESMRAAQARDRAFLLPGPTPYVKA